MGRVSRYLWFIGPMVGAVALVVLTPCALADGPGPTPTIPENIGPASPIHSAGDAGGPWHPWPAVFHGAWAIAAIAAIWRRGWLRLTPQGREHAAPTSAASGAASGAGVVLIAGGVLIYCAQTVGAMSASALLGRGDSAAGIGPEDHGVWRDAGLMLGSYVGALATLAFVVAMIPGIARLIGVPERGRWPRQAGRGVMRGIVGIAVVYPLAWALGWVLALVARSIAGPDAIDPLAHKTLHEIAERPIDAAWWALTALVVIGAPIVEEVVYRGFFQPGIAALTNKPWLAIGITSAVFAFMHASAVPWHALPVLFLLGIGFGVARARTGSLIPSIVMHAIFNAANVAMVGVNL